MTPINKTPAAIRPAGACIFSGRKTKMAGILKKCSIALGGVIKANKIYNPPTTYNIIVIRIGMGLLFKVNLS